MDHIWRFLCVMDFSKFCISLNRRSSSNREITAGPKKQHHNRKNTNHIDFFFVADFCYCFAYVCFFGCGVVFFPFVVEGPASLKLLFSVGRLCPATLARQAGGGLTVRGALAAGALAAGGASAAGEGSGGGDEAGGGNAASNVAVGGGGVGCRCSAACNNRNNRTTTNNNRTTTEQLT